MTNDLFIRFVSALADIAMSILTLSPGKVMTERVEVEV